jgi:antagonist of KipI
MSLQILQSGMHSAVQDAGRTGWRASGISPGGACDPFAARIANYLVGNEAGAAVVEIALGGLRVSVETVRVVAWTGADFTVRLQGQRLPAGRAALLLPGEELAFGYARRGCRAWLAVAGGVSVSPILGSRSYDSRAGLSRPLRSGDLLPLGTSSTLGERLAVRLEESRIAAWGAQIRWASPVERGPELRVVRGSEWDHFDAAVFCAQPFSVTAASDRMGVRLQGPKLSAAAIPELLSEGVAPGTIQVPPGGNPILLLADAQTVGGYPKLAHVVTADLPIAAQLRPEDAVRFREVSLEEARQLLLEREDEVRRFRLGLSLHAA